MKEIGGYIEFEQFFGEPYHKGAIELNCGRNGLAYLIDAKEIKKVYIPYYICESIENVCKTKEIEYEFYSINEAMEPIFEKTVEEGEVLFLVNYYGQFSNEYFKKQKERFKNIIVDNSQAFFQLPIEGIDTIYTCRKFLGVPGGAYLYSDARSKMEYEQDISYNRMNYLLGRFEKDASTFYREYAANNDMYLSEPVKYMSKLTKNILRGIDYDRIKQKRTDNFMQLHNQLGEINQLAIHPVEGGFMYPLLISNGAEVRQKLVEQKIYIPTLWPNVLEECEEGTIEFEFAKNILLLPCDQRYGEQEMEYISAEILKYCILNK